MPITGCFCEGLVKGSTRPWREVFDDLRPDDAIPAAILRGSRVKEGLTQAQLSELTGIPRRHISEMEHGKRPIGKETARKLAQTLECDYRVFL
jgi:plasmid maintenance system antidote protein VapI